MNPTQAQARYGDALTPLNFPTEVVERTVLLIRPSQPRTYRGGPLIVWGFDSTSFHTHKPKLGMLYPNDLPGLCELLGAYCATLLPLGWGPGGIFIGYHARKSPLHQRRLPDDVDALSSGMRAVHRELRQEGVLQGGDARRARHGLVGFADGLVFATIAGTRLGKQVDFVAGVNGTIYESCPPFPLVPPPVEQSCYYHVGGANKRIPLNGSLGTGPLSLLGRWLVATMPPVHGPLLQWKRYVGPHEPEADRLETTGGVVTSTYIGEADGHRVIHRQVVDPDLPHMWPGRIEGEDNSESPHAAGNKRDQEGNVRHPNLGANDLIAPFVEEIYA